MKKTLKKIFSSKKTKKSSQKGAGYILDPKYTDGREIWTYKIDPAEYEFTDREFIYKSLINGKYFKTEEEALKDDMIMTGFHDDKDKDKELDKKKKEEFEKILNGTTQLRIGFRYNPKTGELIGNTRPGYNYEYTTQNGKNRFGDTKELAKIERAGLAKTRVFNPDAILKNENHPEESRQFNYTLGDKVQHHKNTQALTLAREYFHILSMPHKKYYTEFGLNQVNNKGRSIAPIYADSGRKKGQNVVFPSTLKYRTANNNRFEMKGHLQKTVERESYNKKTKTYTPLLTKEGQIREDIIHLESVPDLMEALNKLNDDQKAFINKKFKEDSLRYDLLQYVQQKTQNETQKGLIPSRNGPYKHPTKGYPEFEEAQMPHSANRYGLTHSSPKNQQSRLLKTTGNMIDPNVIEGAIYESHDIEMTNVKEIRKNYYKLVEAIYNDNTGKFNLTNVHDFEAPDFLTELRGQVKLESNKEKVAKFRAQGLANEAMQHKLTSASGKARRVHHNGPPKTSAPINYQQLANNYERRRQHTTESSSNELSTRNRYQNLSNEYNLQRKRKEVHPTSSRKSRHTTHRNNSEEKSNFPDWMGEL